MKRIALDSMIVDKIMDTPGALALVQEGHSRGRLVFIVTHVLEDQLAATQRRDPDRGRRLLETYTALPKRSVPTHGGVHGVSRWGGFGWGDGSETGVSLSQVRTGGRGGLHDALIATTASGEADVLVTEDGTLADKVRSAGAACEAWDWRELYAFLRTVAA